MTRLPTLAASAVLRAAVLLLGTWAFYRLWDLVLYDLQGQQNVGADIGQGLVAFALLVLVAVGWAGWDGRRRRPGEVAALWLAAGVLLGLAGVTVGLAGPGPVDLSTPLGELVGLAAFTGGLVAVPGVLVGSAVALGRRPVATAGRG